MNGAKLSKLDVDSDRLRIFGIVLSRLEIGAVRVRRSGTRQGCFDGLTGGSHYANFETGHRDFVGGFDDGVFRIRIELRVGLLEKGIGQLTWLGVGAVIDKLAN